LVIAVLKTSRKDTNNQALRAKRQSATAVVMGGRLRSTEDKVAILDAAFRKGGSVAAAADRFGVSRGLIYVGRSQVREGLLPGVAMTDVGVSAFSAVAIARDAAPDVQALPPPSPAPMAASPGTGNHRRRTASPPEATTVKRKDL
jgi:transposase-like protein